MSRHVLASTSEIPPGERKLFTVKGRPIVVFNLDGEFYGLFNRCPHEGGSLCDGVVTGLVESSGPGQFELTRMGEIVRCPWHGWEFDIKTGKSFCSPDKVKARTFPAGKAPGSQLVEGPHVAETISVRVDQDYVYVEM